MKVTKKIGNNKVTLSHGKTYRASRPMTAQKYMDFPITIIDLGTGKQVKTIAGFTYDQANEFVNKFNDGASSFDGRYWA